MIYIFKNNDFYSLEFYLYQVKNAKRKKKPKANGKGPHIVGGKQ